MNGKTHIALSIASAAAIGFDPLRLPAIATLALTAGAVLPDIDHRYGAAVLRKPLPTPLRQLARIPSVIFRHRGPLHSLFVLPVILIAAQLLDYLPHPFGLYIAFGCVTHILADMLTPSGVPLLWPFTRRRFIIPLVKTGGRIERSLWLLLLAGWLWSTGR